MPHGAMGDHRRTKELSSHTQRPYCMHLHILFGCIMFALILHLELCSIQVLHERIAHTNRSMHVFIHVYVNMFAYMLEVHIYIEESKMRCVHIVLTTSVRNIRFELEDIK